MNVDRMSIACIQGAHQACDGWWVGLNRPCHCPCHQVDPSPRHSALMLAPMMEAEKVTPREPAKCPGCGLVMSYREEDEQGQCNDCLESAGGRWGLER